VYVDDSVGQDCGQADHTGELPAMILMVAWAVLLLAAVVIPNPPVSRLAVRVGAPLLTVVLIGGTVLLLLNVQSVGC